jgi:hypothetical protein
LNLYFILFVCVLLLGLGWAFRRVRKQKNVLNDRHQLEEESRGHVIFLPQIRQALAAEDYKFLSDRASAKVRRKVRRERLAVAVAYLDGLREDFLRLLHMAKVIASLSPEVVAVQEFERVRLTTTFFWRYQLIRLKLRVGFAPVPQLDSLSDLVSGLSVRMDAAMKELGEHAAELASSMNRRGLGAV